jgi:hypothetical protein
VRSSGPLFSLSPVACSFDGSATTNELNPDAPTVPTGEAGTALDDGSAFDAAPSLDGDAGASYTDGDEILDDIDNCPTIANTNQFNEDEDTLENLCDNCPAEDNQGQGIGITTSYTEAKIAYFYAVRLQ